MAATVLKKSHSLVGKSPFVLINRLREMDTPPVTWAQLKRGHPVDEYSVDQLRAELEGLLGVPYIDILKAAGKDDIEINLRLAVHIAIHEANACGQPPTKTPSAAPEGIQPEKPAQTGGKGPRAAGPEDGGPEPRPGSSTEVRRRQSLVK